MMFAAPRRLAPSPRRETEAARDADTAERPDPFEIDGVIRFRPPPRPERVSEDVWENIFPFDRSEVLRRAARYIIAGSVPDEAVKAAESDVGRERFEREPLAGRLAVLAPFFPDPGENGPHPQAVAAADAVTPTARRGWRRILAADRPEGEAFLWRSWHAPEGGCLICGAPASPDDSSRYGVRHRPGHADAVHTGCLGAMRGAGPAFGRLVAEEALRCSEEPQPGAEEPEGPDAWEEEWNRIAAAYPDGSF